MSERLVVAEAEALELLAHLVASAELLRVEPHYYGTFRLIDAASRLLGFMLERSSEADRAWLDDLKQAIDANKGRMMWDREGYFQFLGEVPARLATELKRRVADGAFEPVGS